MDNHRTESENIKGVNAADSDGKIAVSCCVITYNEEDNIKDCLESVSWADEVIVVDSRSTDRTVDIARDYTDKIIERDFEGHVQQKNFAIEQAGHVWVLCVDADERITPELKAEIFECMKDPQGASGFSMPRLTWYLGRFIRHGGWYPDRKVRLFRKDRGRWGGRNPHDHVQLDGTVRPLNGDIVHYTYKDISDHLSKMDLFTGIAAEEMRKEGKGTNLFDLALRGPLRFIKMYILKLGFLDGIAGFLIAILAAYYVFLKYAKLWEQSR